MTSKSQASLEAFELDVLPGTEFELGGTTGSAGRSTATNSTAHVHIHGELAEEEDVEESSQTTEGLRNESTLAPVDTGFSAMAFLVAAFVVEVLVWSFPFSYGIFLTFYLEDPRFASQPKSGTLLPLAGTLSSGVIYCTGPVIYPLLARFPQHRRLCLWIGGLLCSISLLAASYVTKVTAIVALQGVLYGIGGSMLYAPCIAFLSEWFVKRRGLANGIIFMGSAAGGLVLPFVLPPLLRAHGPSVTLRIFSIAIFVALLPTLPFIKPRLPVSKSRGPRRPAGRRAWFKDWTWWTLLLCNTVVGFGWFVPQLWLPTFAGALNLSSSSASTALAVLNGASALGPLILGFLSDRFSPWLLGVLTCVFASAATFVFWGVVGNVAPGLMVFGMAFGLLGGGWSTLWSGFLRIIAKDDPALATLLYGFLMLSRGLGNVLCSPITTTLSSFSGPTVSQTMYGVRAKSGYDVADGRFEKLIVYVGSCFAGAAIVGLAGWGGEKVRKVTTG
ncbi:hypothetical protein EWM64_g1692 [Hericium alpestre]|uniref:Major facilitator superfamily (MFS) profile domain-containing protein n=1 Tax=Hericium alpestre TaxID=135208 RepID=A0A4Z0A755_9AGAM|nr:hypothetical protein EWM64_g1692 [Hericium alpestre]